VAHASTRNFITLFRVDDAGLVALDTLN